MERTQSSSWIWTVAFWAVSLSFLLQGCNTSPTSAPNNYISSPTTSGLSSLPLLPNPNLTPGAVFRGVGVSDIKQSGYTRTVRDVPESRKREVYAEYGIADVPKQFEVDHLISLELGGSNSIKNLWPESYDTQPWNAHVKDELENRLHDLVCTGQISLPLAQQQIAQNWIVAYKRYFHTDQPLHTNGWLSSYPRNSSRYQRSTTTKEYKPVAEFNAQEVWVNTRSGKYFMPNSRYYGNTKEGEYLTVGEAIRQGYIPARGQ